MKSRTRKILGGVMAIGGIALAAIVIIMYLQAQNSRSEYDALKEALNAASKPPPVRVLSVPESCAEVRIEEFSKICEEEVLSLGSVDAQTCFRDIYQELWPDGESGDEWAVLYGCRAYVDHMYEYGNEEVKNKELSVKYIKMYLQEKMDKDAK